MTIGNRIKMGVKPSKIEWGKIVAEWEFWASGFEKEFQEKLKQLEKTECFVVEKPEISLIKEILGES